ncbi:hypothetical protein LCGC14_0945440 [marine sediment metagenome]|uniref:LamG-like jellyroll fold domain-containing protein n=1 Tax=marine sediment metagenome TaxID=412755 RepID=A0A0F9P4Y6_9ZZZZ
MKKILLLLILLFFLVGTVSAFELRDLDDVKNYDEDLKVYSLKNFFGGKQIAELELKTPTVFKVARGYGDIAEIEIGNGEFDYDEIINGIELYNTRDGMKEIIRNVDYKYKTIVQVPEYKTVCDKDFSANGTTINTNCRQEQVGLKDKIVWEDFTKNSLLKGENITLGIFTEVKKGDKIEWVLNVYGNERLTKWAIWEEGLFVGLVSYYEFEETSGAVVDSRGTNNGTNDGATRGVTGKIGNAFSFDGINDLVNVSDSNDLSFPSAFTFSMWIYPKDNDLGRFLMKGAGGGTREYGIARLNETGIQILLGDSAGNWDLVWSPNNVPIPSNEWSYLAVTWNGTLISIYLNGTLVDTNSKSGSIINAGIVLSIGSNSLATSDFFNGTIDEMGIWNRSLNVIEISDDLWNDRNGCVYGSETCAGVYSLVVTLISPANASIMNTETITFNSTIIPLVYNLTNATTFVWHGDGTLFNSSSVSLSGNSSSNSIINISGFSLGNYIWNTLGVQGNGNGTNSSFATDNFTFILGSTIDSEIHNNVTWETIKEIFTIVIDILSGTEISLVQLVYNNVNYTITNISQNGDQFTLTKSFDIPLNADKFQNQSNNYFYRFTYEGAFIQETINYTQNVSFINLQLCNATYNIMALNFTLLDEFIQIQINASANPVDYLDTFYYWLGDGSIFKNYSFSELNNNTDSDFQFCIYPSNESMKTDLISLYSAEDYSEREYNLKNASITNISSNISLYLLNDSTSVKFTFTVKEGTTTLPDAYVTISKFFIGEGVYKTISIRKTDDSGQFIEYLELDRDYRYSIVKDFILVGVINRRSACSISPCEETLQISTAQGNIWDVYSDVYALNVLSNLSMNRTSEVVTYDFIDITGLAQYFRLHVSRSHLNETKETICNTFSFSSSGSITCNLTGLDGDFIAKTYISRSPEKLDKVINIFIGLAQEVLGILALFFSIAIIITMVFAGAAISGGNPSVVLFMFGITILILKLMTFFPFSWGVVALLEVLTFFLMSKMRT